MVAVIWLYLLAQQTEVDYSKTISETEWSVVEDTEKEIFDAVILEDTTLITATSIKHYRRLRVLSERGASAAELTDISNRTKGIEGRVIDADGTVTTFKEKTDLIETLGYKSGWTKTKSKILVPPGLTSDCIVEMSWSEPGTDGLPQGVYAKRYVIPDQFFCLLKTLKITNTAIRRQTSFLPTRFVWTQIRPPAEFQQTEKNGDYTFVYRNVPPLIEEPFGNEYLDPGMAYVLIFKTFPDYGKEPQSFWSDFGKRYVNEVFDIPYNTPKHYDVWIDALKKQMTGDLQKDAATAFHAFAAKYRMSSFLTAEERASMKPDLEILNDRLLLSSVEKAGYTPAHYLAQILMKVFKDLKFEPYVVFASSVESAPFRLEEMNPFVLDISYPLVALITGEDQWLVFAPSDPQYPAGFVPAYYRGQTAIGFSDATKWGPTTVSLPRLPWDNHVALRQYEMTLETDGKAQFRVVEQGRGRMAARLRNSFFQLSDEERSDLLRSIWQRRARSWLISNAKVVNASRFDEAISCQVEGQITLDIEGSEWIALNPFPGDRGIIDLDYEWRKQRIQPILLPSSCGQIDETHCVLPEGWSVIGDPSWEKGCGMGSVRFTVKQEGRDLFVKREMVLENSLVSKEAQPHLMILAAWMEEAMNQTLAIDTNGGAL
ncbi:MAG: hypothetical protein KDC35_19910 [Acidobacteria bacterium]|nr:hypothetical protein [Acidobacteriota bacterium]